MKVVINRCYGGYGLSAKALARVAELQGRPCYFIRNPGTPHQVAVSIEEVTDRDWTIQAFGAPRAPTHAGTWHELTLDERQAYNAAYTAAEIPNFRDDRSNPILVQVVEELGAEASGRFAKLTIVEVPDDAEWQIEEYDGNEHVAERHRTWS